MTMVQSAVLLHCSILVQYSPLQLSKLPFTTAPNIKIKPNQDFCHDFEVTITVYICKFNLWTNSSPAWKFTSSGMELEYDLFKKASCKVIQFLFWPFLLDFRVWTTSCCFTALKLLIMLWLLLPISSSSIFTMNMYFFGFAYAESKIFTWGMTDYFLVVPRSSTAATIANRKQVISVLAVILAVASLVLAPSKSDDGTLQSN